jgi:hypothetical protein
MKEMNKERSEFGVRMEDAMVCFATKRSKYIKIVSHDAKRAETCDLRLLKCMCEPYLLRQVHCQSVWFLCGKSRWAIANTTVLFSYLTTNCRFDAETFP